MIFDSRVRIKHIYYIIPPGSAKEGKGELFRLREKRSMICFFMKICGEFIKGGML